MLKTRLLLPFHLTQSLWKKIQSAQSLRFAIGLLLINVAISYIYYDYSKGFCFSFYTIYMLCGAIVFYELTYPFKLIKKILFILLGVIFVIITLSNITAQKYFNSSLDKIINSLLSMNIEFIHLPHLLHQYLSVNLIILPVLLITPYLIYFYNTNNPETHVPIPLIIFIILVTAALQWTKEDKNTVHFASLITHVRIHPIVHNNLSIALPNTILIIINESTGNFFQSAKQNNLRLENSIIKIAKYDTTNWLEFRFAVTNAPVTNISVPSLTTGSAPYEGYNKLHSLPFIWDLAKMRGYQTAFFTTQTLHWSDMDDFYKSAQIDYLISAENAHLPLINDLGVDDILIAKRIAHYILSAAPQQKIFIVMHNNALHFPYQDKSSVNIPATLNNRHQKATYIVEETYRIIFNALAKASRLQQSLIIINADHGEDIFKTRDILRADGGEYEEFLRIPFLVHIPASTSFKIKQILQFNTNRLVNNLDIAPTLSNILGLTLPKPYQYAGYSLLSKIPKNRLSISLSTNEWRQWHSTGFALARQNDRFLCITNRFCSYYDLAVDPAEKQPIHKGKKYQVYLSEAMAIPILRHELQEIMRPYNL